MIKALIAKSSFQSGIFVMLYVVILKMILCISRRVFNKETGMTCFTSEFFAGLISLAYKSLDRRAHWVMFLLTRAVDFIYTS